MYRAFLMQSALEASKPANVTQKKALEGAAKRRKAQRPPDENTPGASRQGACPSRKKQKEFVGSQSLENSKTANRKARERRAQEQAWSCARKAATRAAQNFSRRHVADFRASRAQRMCEGGLESECSELGAEVEKAARAAYLNHLQVPFE